MARPLRVEFPDAFYQKQAEDHGCKPVGIYYFKRMEDTFADVI